MSAWLRGASSALVCAGLLGCSDPAAQPAIDRRRQSVAGGLELASADHDAIGALVALFADGRRTPFCTATVVAPQLLLTAKHCWLAVPPGLPVAFAVGHDARAPQRLLEIDGAAWDRTRAHGVIGFGLDVALAHLMQPLEGIEPLPLAALSDRRRTEAARVGDAFLAVGYGGGASVQGTQAATRSAGVMRLKSVGGKLYQHAYGSFENLLSSLQAPSDPEPTPEELSSLQQLYDGALLDPEYEAFFGRGPAAVGPESVLDVSIRQGDSGGPILGAEPSSSSGWAVFGVASGGLVTEEERGAVFALLGPAALALLETPFEPSAPDCAAERGRRACPACCAASRAAECLKKCPAAE